MARLRWRSPTAGTSAPSSTATGCGLRATTSRRTTWSSWRPKSACLPIEPGRVLHKGRLQPGKMFLVSLEEGRIIDDTELKMKLAAERPYAEWLQANLRPLEAFPGGGPSAARWGRAVPAADGLRVLGRGPEVHPRAHGEERRRSASARWARTRRWPCFRPPPAALQLLPAALRAGHEPAARRDPRRARHLGEDRHRAGGQPPRPGARKLPPGEPGYRPSSTTSSWRSSSR